MSEYEIKISGMIYRRRDGAWIPPEPANADYKEYLEWVAAGNMADQETPP
jgi:hypothetical protein